MKNLSLLTFWALSLIITWEIAKNVEYSYSDKVDAIPKNIATKPDYTANSLPVKNSQIENGQKRVRVTRTVNVNSTQHQRNYEELLNELDINEKWDLSFKNIRDLMNIWNTMESFSAAEIHLLMTRIASSGSDSDMKSILVVFGSTLIAEKNASMGLSMFASSKDKKSFDIINFISSWSKEQPLDALNWLKENQTKDFRDSYLHVFRNLGKEHPEKALQEIELLEGDKKINAIKGLVYSFQNSEEYSNLLQNFPHGEFKKESATIIHSWAKSKPLDALSWVELSISEENQGKHIKTIKRTWVKDNPEIASDWIMENSENPEQDIEIITKSWYHAEDLINWLQEQPEEDYRDTGYVNVIKTHYVNNPKKANELLGQVQSHELKVSLISELYNRFHKNGEEKQANSFLAVNSDLSEEEKLKIVEGLSID